MPTIPTFENDVSVRPGGAAQASPAAFAAPGEALARSAGQFTDEMAAFNARYMDAKRQADAAHANAGLSEGLDNLQHKWSQVPDRDQAQAGFDTDAATLRKQTLAGISDPLTQQHVAAIFDGEAIARRYDAANAAFRLESGTRVAQLDADNNSAANLAASASNDLLRAKLVDDRLGAIQGAVKAGWLQPVEGEQMQLGFRSQVQEVAARAQMNSAIDAQDGRAADALAQRLSDPKEFQGLLPERREILQQRLENLSYRLDTRAASAQAHKDAQADKVLRQNQSHNEAMLLASVSAGHPLSDSDIVHLADSQQISAGGVEALIAAKNRAEDGRDNPDAALRLWHAIGTKQATSGEIFDALHSGAISKSTSVTMMRSLDATANKDTKGNETAAFNQLKTVLHGGAIEQGIIPDKSPEAALWAQAQGEWHGRVTAGGEDPAQVLPDMLKRYGTNTAAPTWLTQPRLGTVQSAQDLAAVAAKTGQAHKDGKISDADYQAQLKLLSQYKVFYGLQAATKPAPAKPAGAP
jgi:hypothetical protein